VRRVIQDRQRIDFVEFIQKRVFERKMLLEESAKRVIIALFGVFEFL
jgi:hypothetical protein